ncbi:unnamed protein product [Microthlaspi erraticum]|uniref:DUF8039 domain-containing protein n=1 Tax=Microthlaspi erraticum TaxID=1685480 RepID=A0A6D2HWT1_9BRAS|nr:unnamed protein product [Microthlaspi erraticum]
MRRVAKDPDDKVSVEFTDIGEHAGPGSVTLSSFVGPLVREHVLVLLEFADKIEQIQSLHSQMDSTANDNRREDAVSQVLRKDKPGRVRGIGRGVTATKLAFIQSRDSHVQKLEATQAELLCKVTQLQNKVCDLAGKQSQCNDVGSQYDVSDNSNRDKVVAEGLLQSTDPKEMVNNIPLGPNAAVLKITKVIKNDAYLWRPSAEMFLMGAAIDTTIAWPIHKIEFVVKATQAESARKSTTSASNSTGTNKNQAKRCILLDCKNSVERVALGRVSLSDPADVVHFVPLGHNASKVWVDVSKIGIFEVWRPNSEIKFLRDAVGTTIAWPNDKIIFM